MTEETHPDIRVRFLLTSLVILLELNVFVGGDYLTLHYTI